MDKHHFGGSTFWSNEHPQQNRERARTCAHHRGKFSVSKLFDHPLLSKLFFGQVIGLEDESYLYYNGPFPQCKE